MQVYELNMDGLVGPTHNYAGLAEGNVASTLNALTRSNPQEAAKQGLKKMRLLHHMGIKQAVLPPHQRPNMHLLYQLGFKGSPAQQIAKAYKTAPHLVHACYSASSMWAANAATVSASADTVDHKVHFTAANLLSLIHRHQEASFSKKVLERLFSDPLFFHHHPLLPCSNGTSDEGAANHNRLCRTHAHEGINFFIYGKDNALLSGSKIFLPRQSKEASEAIARNHQLNPQKVLFAQQNPEAIDAGVFHNDVIAVANEYLFFIHEEALINQAYVLKQLQELAPFPIRVIELPKEQLSLKEAVSSYLFNSQIVSVPNSKDMVLIAPIECQQQHRVASYLESLLKDSTNPINAVHYLDLKQSMRNGGGPACLRLRVPLKLQELQAMHQGVLVQDTLLDDLEAWVTTYYRSELHVQDLACPQLIEESLNALEALTRILKLGAIYPFQQEVSNK